MSDQVTGKKKNALLYAVAIVVVICVCLAIAATGTVIMVGYTTQPAAEITEPQGATVLPSELPKTTPEPSPAPPTNTAAPSAVPLPTQPPTETPIPTATLPPTATPEPLVLSGQGDSVLDVSFPGPGILQITGNDASRHFAVESYGASGDQIDLLVNTTEPYQGHRTIDWDTTRAARLVISASGPWQIIYYPLLQGYVNTVNVPGTYQGTGDDVIALAGAVPDTAVITGNADASHFAIVAHTASTAYEDLLVNTTDPYQGTVIISPNTVFLVIDAEGPWTIQVTGK